MSRHTSPVNKPHDIDLNIHMVVSVGDNKGDRYGQCPTHIVVRTEDHRYIRINEPLITRDRVFHNC